MAIGASDLPLKTEEFGLPECTLCRTSRLPDFPAFRSAGQAHATADLPSDASWKADDGSAEEECRKRTGRVSWQSPGANS